jgi:oxygen-independent coproporphyrinogen-3 oxidase
MNDLWQPIQFDRELIRKYDRPGPRYTSYPTAPQFTADFGSAQYSDLLAASVPAGRPLSLYVHIPFCAHRCFFCGCNVTISHDRSWGKRYLPFLEREMAMAAERLDAPHREVIQIHWGGGTPTFLPPEDLTELMAAIRRHFRVALTCEIGVEVDPRECSAAHLDALTGAGVNRLSMGLQELDPQVQRAVNRMQSVEQTWAVIDHGRRRGVESVNVDLIYGLPHQTPDGFVATVREVISMAPDRLALFNFAYLPQMFPHQKTIRPETLPDPEAKLWMLEEAIAALTVGGYLFIGMDHFARPGDPLAEALRDRTLTRNFQGYSTCAATDLVAFGVSSISEVAGGYAQNVKELGDYRAALESGHFPTCRGLWRSAEDELRRDVILELMCHFRLDKAAIEGRHAIDFDSHFGAELELLAPMAAEGLLELTPRRIEVTPRGRLLVRNIAMAFDSYLLGAGHTAGATRYSRTV